MTEKNRGSTHDPSEGEDAEGDLGNVPALEEVGSLEDLLVRNAVLPDRRLEPGEGQNGLGTASDFDYMIATIAATHMSLSTLSLSFLSRASTPLRSLHQAALQAGVPPTKQALLIDGGCPASE